MPLAAHVCGDLLADGGTRRAVQNLLENAPVRGAEDIMGH